MLSFPGSPRTGQSYAAPNGQIYVFDGVKWIGTSVSGGGGTTYLTTENPFTFSVAADDSTQRSISNGELIKFIGAGTVTTSSDAEGYITITGSGGGGASTGDITFSTNNISAPVGANVNVKTANNGSGDAGDVNLTAGTGSVNDGVVRISTAGTYEWQFDNGGILTVPGRITLGTDAGIYGLGDFIGLLPANTSSAGLEIDGVNDAILAAMRDVTIRANAGSPWKNWTFKSTGDLQLPGNLESNSNINIEINLADSTKRIWQFGEDGDFVLPGGSLKHDNALGFFTVEGPVTADMIDAGSPFSYHTISNGVEILTHRPGDDLDRKFRFSWDGALYMPTDSSNGQVGALEWRINNNSTTSQVRSTPGGGIFPPGLALVSYGENPGISFNVNFNKNWIFDQYGNTRIPGDIVSEGNINIDINLTDSTLRRWSFGEDGNLTFPDGTNYSGKSITLPTTNGVSNSVSWTFSDVSIGSDTVRLEWNLLTTKQPDWWLGFNDATSNDDYFHFSSINQSIGFAPGGIEGGGLLTFGTIAHGGAGSANDIELTSISGDVYIRTANNYWKFGSDGYSWFPNFLGVAGDMTVNNIVTGSVSGDFKGSLFGDDSTKIIDAVENKIYATEITGTIVGAPVNDAAGKIIRVYASSTYYDQSNTGATISVFKSLWTSQVQVGWIITFKDGTTRVITSVNEVFKDNIWYTLEFSFAEGYTSTDAYPLTIQSPNYTLSSSQSVKINSNGHEWQFDKDGVTTLPYGAELDKASAPIEFAEYQEQVDGFRYGIQEYELWQVAYASNAADNLYPIRFWEVDGTNAQYYQEYLQDAWSAQNESTLLIIPAISSAFYNQARVALGLIKSKYDAWQTALKGLKVTAGDYAWTFGSDGRLLLSDDSGVILLDPTTGAIKIGDSINADGSPTMPSTHIAIGGSDVFVISTGQWMGPGRGDNANPAWVFDRDANFKIPGNITSNSNINVEINLTDSTKRIWSFGEDGNLTIPGTIANSEGTVDFQLYNDNFRFNTYNQFGGATYIEGQPDYLFLMGNQSTLIGANGNSWDFTAEGNLHIPGDIRSDKDIVIEVNLFDSTLRRWQFGEDGVFNTAGDIIVGDGSGSINAGSITGTSLTVGAGNVSAGTVTSAALTGLTNLTISTPYNVYIDTTLSGSVQIGTQNANQGTVSLGSAANGVGVSIGGKLGIEVGVHEKFQAKSSATGVVTHDCSSGHVFYHTSPSANWTANFTNLNLSTGYATSVSLVIIQGGTGYYPNAVQIGGVSQTINWQGNTNPTVSTNRTDVVTFSIINNSGTYTVLGQLTGF